MLRQPTSPPRHSINQSLRKAILGDFLRLAAYPHEVQCQMQQAFFPDHVIGGGVVQRLDTGLLVISLQLDGFHSHSPRKLLFYPCTATTFRS